jgi:flagellar biosynthetic protein FliO
MKTGFRMIRKLKLFLLLLCFCFSGIITASQASVSGNSEQVQQNRIIEQQTFGERSLAGMFIRTIFALLLIIISVYIGVYIIKRFASGKTRHKGSLVSVAGSTYLGPKKSIYLVDVQDKRLVLGVTDTSIQLLTEIDRPETDETESGDYIQSGADTFHSFLTALIRKRNDESK